MSRFAIGFFLLHVISSLVSAAHPAYERVEGLRGRFANKVFRTEVKPHWLPGNTRFWYRIQTGPNAFEYVMVDAAAGNRTAAFDHTKLAEALSKAGEKDVRSENLTLENLNFSADGKELSFHLRGKRWSYELPAGELRLEEQKPRVSAPGKKLDRVPRMSRRTGSESQVTFANRTDGLVEFFWISTEGERVSYAKLQPGTEHVQHTYSGHVWVAVNSKGETIFAVEAEDQPLSFEVTAADKPLPAAARNPERQRTADQSLSPDGKWRVVLKDFNLWLVDTASGKETQLTRDGTEEDRYTSQAAWSPDSRKFAGVRVKPVVERKVTLIESSPKDQLQPKVITYDYFKPGDVLPHPRPQLFDVVAARQIPIDNALFPNPFEVDHQIPIRWEPDSSRFTFPYNQRGHQVFRIIGVNAESGAATAVVDETCQTFFCYSSKQYDYWLNKTRELIWMSERSGWNHLWLIDAATGTVKNPITSGSWVVRGVDRVDEEARQIWFRAGGIRPGQDPYFVHHCRVNFDGQGLVILTEGDGTHSIDWSPDRKFFIDTWSRVDLPPVIQLRRDDGSFVCDLERATWTSLLAEGWIAPERFAAKGRDGTTDIYGVIYRPTDFEPTKKYPVIEYIYAGPHSAFVPKSFSTTAGGWVREMAELGFIVVQCDGMGTSHRSKAFHDVCWQNLGDSGFADRIAWIRAAAAKYPSMDLTRVGIYGGSAGGQSSTRALLAHGDFYKVAVSDCGCHDNRMDKIWWNEQWMGWPIGPHYEEQSNVTQAKRLEGKLMLIVGELDKNVDPASTMQVANALVKADKDFDLLIIPGAGHGAAESPYGKRRRAEFFLRHLQP